MTKSFRHLILLAGWGLALSFWIRAVSTSAQVPAHETAGLKGIETRYHLLLALKDPPRASWADVRFTPLTPEDLGSAPFARYSRFLAQEFGKYPPGLVETAHLHTIALVRDLSYAYQLRAALPDFVKEILYLDVYRGNSSEMYQRHVIHHEFYHLLEEQVFGSPYYKDPRWAALNASGFSYGSGGVNAQTGNQYGLIHPQPGFINQYSLSGLEEDKAEIYAALMVPAEAKKINEWSQQDVILRNKITSMKAFLRSRVPVMNESYWAQLQP